MKTKRFIKIIATILVFTLLCQEVVNAGGLAILQDKKNTLQPQHFLSPMGSNPQFLHENYIKFALGYILESIAPDVEKCNRRIFDHNLVPGLGFVFDLRNETSDDPNGKRRDGKNWIIPCAIGREEDIRQDHTYKWAYEAIVGPDNNILDIRKRYEGTRHVDAAGDAEKDLGPGSNPEGKKLRPAKEIRREFFKKVLLSGRLLSVKQAKQFLDATKNWNERRAKQLNISQEELEELRSLGEYSASTIEKDLKAIDGIIVRKTDGKNQFYLESAEGTIAGSYLAKKSTEVNDKIQEEAKKAALAKIAAEKELNEKKEAEEKALAEKERKRKAEAEEQKKLEAEKRAKELKAKKEAEEQKKLEAEKNAEAEKQAALLKVKEEQDAKKKAKEAAEAKKEAEEKELDKQSSILEQFLLSAAEVNGWEDPSYRKGQVEAIKHLKDGVSVELRTGGGKTLTLGAAAFLRHKQKGERTLILTHEDALTEQALEKNKMGEILSALGLVTGFIIPDSSGQAEGVIYRNGHKQTVSPEEVYAECTVIYSKWDRVVHRYMAEKKGSVQHVLSNNKYFALFDEADLTMVFGSSTPAVISGTEMEDKKTRLKIRRGINTLVGEVLLKNKNLYYAPAGTKEIYLTPQGEIEVKKHLERIEARSSVHKNIIRRSGEAFVLDALRAHLFYKEGVQYLPSWDAEGEVVGVNVRDEHTGARKKGMSFGEGLQQAIEVMAGVQDENITPETYTAMSMTVVQFLKDKDIVVDFAGASGTMETDRFKSIYTEKAVVSVEGEAKKLDRSSKHTGFNTKKEKKKELINRIKSRMAKGQPIMIKVESEVETNEIALFISTYLRQSFKDNYMLLQIADAKRPDEFSKKISKAGYANAITIVTNLAHRGIDVEITGCRINPDGTDGEDVKPKGVMAPGLHVISSYLDEAEAFEIQTQGRADRGANQGSWEGLFSLDEVIFLEHKDLLTHHRAGLAKAIKENNTDKVEELVAQLREIVLSEKNSVDEKRRKYEDEVFGYQNKLISLIEATSTDEKFISFLEGIGAYSIIAEHASSKSELSVKLKMMRQSIRAKMEEALERFQTEQQETRKRINYLASLSRLGVRGAFTQLNAELVSAIKLARNFENKIEDVRAYIQEEVAEELGEKIEEVKPTPRTRVARFEAKTVILSIALVVGVAAVLSIWGVQPLVTYICDPAISFMAKHPVVSVVSAAFVLIPTTYIRQIYANKISQLDTSTVDFMRFTAGIGEGNPLKAFVKWFGTMALQLLAGPGLFAGAGTLITAVTHPVILGPFEPFAIPAALVSVGSALLANLALVIMNKGHFEKVKHVEPTRFQQGLNSFMKTVAVLIGLLVALQSGFGDLTVTALSLGAIIASTVVSNLFSWSESRFYKEDTPRQIGITAGILGTAGLLILSSILGSGVLYISALSIIKVTIGIVGIGMVILQSLQAVKLAKDAARDGQNPFRAAIESYLPNARNIMMYATAIPAVLLNFNGFASAAFFVASVIGLVVLLYKYSVNIEKGLGRFLSRGITTTIGGTMMAAAGVTPMVVLPERAYGLQQNGLRMREMLQESGLLEDTHKRSLERMRTYPREQFGGFKILGENIENFMDAIMDSGLADEDLDSERETDKESVRELEQREEALKEETDEKTSFDAEDKPSLESTPFLEGPELVDFDASPRKTTAKRGTASSKAGAILLLDGPELDDFENELLPAVEADRSGEKGQDEDVDVPLEANQQNISSSSPLAVTVIAAHIESRAPIGVPRQTNEEKKSKQDPADFMHIRNISGNTINLADYSVADSKGERYSIRECSGGRDIFLKSGQEIRIMFSGNDIAQHDLKRLTGSMVIVPEGLSKSGETVYIYDPRGREIVKAKSGEQQQDDIALFSLSVEEGKVKATGRRSTADPIRLSRVSHSLNDFRRTGDVPGIPDKKPEKKKDVPKDVHEEGTWVPSPELREESAAALKRRAKEQLALEENFLEVEEGGWVLSDELTEEKRVTAAPGKTEVELMSYDEALKAYKELTNWRGRISGGKDPVKTLKLALRSALGEIAEGRTNDGRWDLPGKIYRSLKAYLGKEEMTEDPGMAILARGVKLRKEPESLAVLLGEYDAITITAERLFAHIAGGKADIKDILDIVLRDGYQIRQAKYRLTEAEMLRGLAESGRLFLDLELSYGNAQGAPHFNSYENAEKSARENAARLSEAQRELAEDRLALANDQRQLEEAQSELEDDLDALANDQRQLEEAIAEGDEDRIAQERAEIEENEREIRNDRARIRQEEAEIIDDEQEITEGEQRSRALDAEIASDLKLMRELREPELRLKSTLGIVLYDAEQSQAIKSREARERRQRINVELAKIELVDRVIQVYVDIITAKSETEVLAQHLKSLEAMRERTSVIDVEPEDIVTLDMYIAKAKSELLVQEKVVLDRKSELRYILGLPTDVAFEMDEAEYDLKRLRTLMSGLKVDMDQYFALVLAQKSEEIETHRALVPDNIFERLNVKVGAVWEEDILRRILYKGLRDPSFVGVRASAVLFDPKQEKQQKEAMLLYLKSIDEYKLIERMQYTMTARAQDTIEAAEEEMREQATLAQKALEQIEGLTSRKNAGFGEMTALLRAKEEAKDIHLEKARAHSLLLRAEVARVKSSGTTRMQLDKYNEKELETIIGLIEQYGSDFTAGRFPEAELVWQRVRRYLPGLVMPMSERQINVYKEKVERFKDNVEDLPEEKRKTTDKLALHIRDNLTVEQRRSLAALIKRFDRGRPSLGNYLRFRVISNKEMTEILDKMSEILPEYIPDSSGGLSLYKRRAAVIKHMQIITSALDMASYSIEGSEIVDMFLVACERGRLGPVQKDVEIARNMARDDGKAFVPVVTAGIRAGIEGDVFNMSNFDAASSLTNTTGAYLRLDIPLNNPGRREKTEMGHEFITSSLIKLKLAERELQVEIARELIAMHDLMEQYENLKGEEAILEERIGALRLDPSATRIDAGELEKDKQRLLIEQKNVLFQLKIARNNLRDILGLEYSDIVLIDNITNQDIEKMLDTLKESLEGNFVLSSTVELVKEGSMVTVGPDNELAANNIPTGLKVVSRREIRVVAIKDRKGDYIGQFALDRGEVISSDIKSIPNGSWVGLGPDGELNVVDNRKRNVDTSDMRLKDLAFRYIVSVNGPSGESAGEMLIDYRTGDEALKVGIHRAERRGHALRSVVIIKEGNRFSIAITVYPYTLAGYPMATIYPKLPDSWLDWKALGWLNLPGFLTGAHRRQKRRKVLSGVAMKEAQRQDILMQKAEEVAERQKESTIKLYRLAKRKVDLTKSALKECQAEIARLSALSADLDDPSVIERLRTEEVRLEGLKDQAENNLASMKILLSVLDIDEADTYQNKEEAAAELIGLEEALERVGARAADEMTRLDIIIAQEMQKLATFTNMFEGRLSGSAYSGRNATSDIRLSLTFSPEINAASIAAKDVEDKKILSGLSMENARSRIIDLYGSYAEAAMRVRELEARIGHLRALTAESKDKNETGTRPSYDLKETELALARARIAKMEAEQVFSLGMTELAIFLQSKTGVVIDPTYLTERLGSYPEGNSLDKRFEEHASGEEDKIMQHLRNRRERALLQEEQALWAGILPTLKGEVGWANGSARSGFFVLSAVKRLLGGGEAIKARLASLEAERLADAEADRVKQIRYEWDLIQNELATAMEESIMTSRAMDSAEGKIKYILEKKKIDYALGGRTDVRDIRRLSEEYEELKFRYFKANIRLNIAYARAVNMLNGLMGIDGAKELIIRTGKEEEPAISGVSGKRTRDKINEDAAQKQKKIKEWAVHLDEKKKEAPQEDEGVIEAESEKPRKRPLEASVKNERAGPKEAEENLQEKKEASDAQKEKREASASQRHQETSINGLFDSGVEIFADLNTDISVILSDLRGESDPAREVEIVKVEASPTLGNGRFVIEEIRPEGQAVRKGDWLVKLDSSSLERELAAEQKAANQTRRTIIAAEEAIAEAEKKKKGVALIYEEALNAAKKKKDSGERMLAEAEARIKTAEANVVLAEQYLKMVEALRSENVASKMEYYRALAIKYAAIRTRDEARLEKTTAAEIIKAAEAEEARIKAAFTEDTGVLDGEIKTANALLKAARQKLKLQLERISALKESIERCTILSQADGIIEYTNISSVYLGTIPLEPASETVMGPGVSVAHGQQIMRIVDPKTRLNKIRPGHTLEEVELEGSIIRADIKTGVGSRQGMTGIPIRNIVPEGTYVQKDDVIVQFDDSVLLDLLRQAEQDLTETNRRIAEAASLLKSGETIKATYIEEEYPALKRKAEAELTEARERHEASKRKVKVASERVLFFRKRLLMAIRAEKQKAISPNELRKRQAEYNAALLEEYIARAEMETALLAEIEAETALEELASSHVQKLAEFDRQIKSARRQLVLMREDAEIDRGRIAFYRKQIANCTVRADREGEVNYINDQVISLAGSSLKPLQEETVIGPGAIVPPGVPFLSISDRQDKGPQRILTSGVNSLIDQTVEANETAGGKQEPVVCRIKPLRLYDIVGYGATLTYIVPNGSVVDRGDKVAEFDPSVFERERGLERRLINETRAAIFEATKSAEEFKKHKAILLRQYRSDKKTAEEKVKAGESMLAEAEQNLEKAEANVVLAERELERMQSLVASSVESLGSLMRALLKLNSAERAREEANNEIATARRMIREGNAELRVLEAVRSREITRLEGEISRAENNAEAYQEKLKRHLARLKTIEENIENCVVYAQADGKVVHADQISTSLFRFPIKPVPRELIIGPGITVGYGQNILSIVEPSEARERKTPYESTGDVTFVESHVTTAYDSGSGVIYPAIKKIHVQDGEYVKEGQVLLELESSALVVLRRDEEILLQEAQLFVSQAVSLLAESSKKLKEYTTVEYPALLLQHQARLKHAQETYKARRKSRTSAERIVALRKELLEIIKRVMGASAASKSEVEAMEAEYNAAVMLASIASYEEALALSRVQEAEREITRIDAERDKIAATLTREVETATERVSLAKENEAIHQQRVDFYQEQIDNCVIRATSSGRVSFIHSLPLEVLRIPFKRVPKERVIAEGEVIGPGPIMKITRSIPSEEESERAQAHIKDMTQQESLPSGASAVNCTMEPITFGRRGAHGFMILRISPEGKVRKGQVLVEFDTSSQETLIVELERRINDSKIISLDAERSIESYEAQKKILEMKKVLLRLLGKQFAASGDEMEHHARTSEDLAVANILLSEKDVQRALKLLQEMVVPPAEYKSLQISKQQQMMIRHRAARELADAIRVQEGTSGFAAVASQIERDRIELESLIERMRLYKKAADSNITMYSGKIEVIRSNIADSVIYAQQDGWIKYTHDVGENVAGIQIKHVANPVYIGTGSVVRSGQSVMNFFTEKPETITDGDQESSGKGVRVRASVHSGESNWTGPIGARILEIPKKSGDMVEKGETILVLDPSEIIALKKQTEMELLEAQRSLRESELLAEEAERRLKEYRTKEYPARSGQIKARIVAAKALIKDLETLLATVRASSEAKKEKHSTLRAAKELGTASQKEVDRARAAWNASVLQEERIAYRIDEAVLSLREAEYDLRLLDNDRMITENILRTEAKRHEDKIRINKKTVMLLEKRIRFYDEQIENCEIKAPRSGKLKYNSEVSYTFFVDRWVPREIMIEVGYEVPPGVTIAYIADPADEGSNPSWFSRSPIGLIAFVALMAGITRAIIRRIRAAFDVIKYGDPRHIGPPDWSTEEASEGIEKVSFDADAKEEKTETEDGGKKEKDDDPEEEEEGNTEEAEESTENELQEQPEVKGEDEPEDEIKKNKGGKGPMLGLFILSMLLPLSGCVQNLTPAEGSAGSFWGAGSSWYASISQAYPAVHILTFIAIAAALMMTISYIMVAGKDNKKESVARLESFATRPGIYVSLALTLGIMYFFPGFPPVESWAQAIEVLKMFALVAAFVTFPISIAETYLIGLIRRDMILRFRVPFPTGIVKLRHNSVAMSIMEGTKRLFKWWGIFTAVSAVLVYVMPNIVAPPVTQGPSLTLKYVMGMITHLYNEVAAMHPYIGFLKWLVIAVVSAAALEIIVKRFLQFLDDDNNTLKRAGSKLVMLGLTIGLLFALTPYLPAVFAFPQGVSLQHILTTAEVVVIFTFVIASYFLVSSYIMGIFSSRINRVYQVPPLFNMVIARFRTNSPRLVSLQRIIRLMVSLVFVEAFIVMRSSAPLLLKVGEWYSSFALQNPAIIVGAWITATIIGTIFIETIFDLASYFVPSLRKDSMIRQTKFLSFSAAALMVSWGVIGFPPIAGWGQVVSWLEVFILGMIIIGLPIQIAGAFLLGIRARVLHLRVLVPFLAHVKTRIRELERHQSDALKSLFNIWRWLILTGTVILYSAPIVFNPSAPGGVRNPLLSFIYAKAVKWTVFLSGQYPFVNVIYWGSMILLLSALLEVGLKKIIKFKSGDEYMPNRLIGKVSAVIIALTGGIILGALPAHLKAAALSISVLGIVVFGFMELTLNLTFKEQTKRIRGFFKGTSFVFLGMGLIALMPVFPAAISWASFWPAAEVGALVLAGISVYLMVSAFALGIFIPRINRVTQPLITFFFLVTRSRSEDPPMIVVTRMLKTAIISAALAFIFGTQEIILGIILGAGILLYAASYGFNAWQAQRAFKYKDIFIFIKSSEPQEGLTASRYVEELREKALKEGTRIAVRLEYVFADVERELKKEKKKFSSSSAQDVYAALVKIARKGISPHRREEKFELENANEEPELARDMLEAMGMKGDKFNPTKTYYYNHSLYLDTPGYRWKGFLHFLKDPVTEVRDMYTAHSQLLTYFARENSYRKYRYKARIRWYGDKELIDRIFAVNIEDGMTTDNLIDEIRASLPEGDHIVKRFEAALENLPEYRSASDAKIQLMDFAKTDKKLNKLKEEIFDAKVKSGMSPEEFLDSIRKSLPDEDKVIFETALTRKLKGKLLDLAGQTKADKGKVHLEIKNRLDTRMWKFETGAWAWAVPHILALSDGGGTVKKNGHAYVFRTTRETKDFFGIGKKAEEPTFFRVDRKTGEKTVAERIERTDTGYRAFIDGTWISFRDSEIDRGIDLEWLPEKYQGKNCRTDRQSVAGLKQFCNYIKQYKLAPTVQVSYERLEYVSADGKKDVLLKRLVPLAQEYRKRMINGPDAARWRSIYNSSAGKYLRAILNAKDPLNPGINITEEDLNYLRMTLDMNVRWRDCDDMHNPTLFTGLDDFTRTWPEKTILEVKYREQKAPGWVYQMVKDLDKRRERMPVKDYPIRRQPAGKYCDSVSVWLYKRLLAGDFAIKGLRQALLRLIGLEGGYPESANAAKWEGYSPRQFKKVFDIDDRGEPYVAPYGIPPLGYGLSKVVETAKVSRDEEKGKDPANEEWFGAMIPVLSDALTKVKVSLKAQSWIEQLLFGAAGALALMYAGAENLKIVTGLLWGVFALAHYLPGWLGAKTTHSPPQVKSVLLIAGLNAFAFLFYFSQPLVFLILFTAASAAHHIINVNGMKTSHEEQEDKKDSEQKEVIRKERSVPTEKEYVSSSISEEALPSVPEKEITRTNVETEIRYKLLEASGDAAFASAFTDAVFSFYREKRKIVFAFDTYLGAGQGKKPMNLVMVIEDLKADHRYAEFLKNIEIIRFDTSRGERGTRSLQERLDSGALVFSFSRDTQEAHEVIGSMTRGDNHKLAYIDESQVAGILTTEKVYYPLFEIVTISLARHIDEMTIEDIKAIGEKISISPREEMGALVFTILPSIKRFDTNREFIQHYAMKKKILLAA